jgi:predicted PhzF superfamily epimerase YddE/YHI9
MNVTIVDAFAGAPFEGNPAGVCVLEREITDDLRRKIAREINASETAFIMKEGAGYALRWFTPETEVDLCGHATLAGAHVLYESGLERPDIAIRFFTRSGELIASRDGGRIILDFPAEPAREATPPRALVDAMKNISMLHTGRNRFDYLVETASEEEVRACRPDFGLLETVPCRGVIVTSRASSPGFDFVSRFFAPAVGIREDPVTGSAHCCLAPYWMEKLGKGSMTARQVSARGGILSVTMKGDRVLIGGTAVTVLRGEMHTG